MIDHILAYAKAYTAAVAPFLTIILQWAVTKYAPGLDPSVQMALVVIVMTAITGGTVAYVPNKPQAKP